jgi:hypothetical protein
MSCSNVCQHDEVSIKMQEAGRMLHPTVEEDMEERVARLESDVAHIRSDIGQMKIDIREMRRSVDGDEDALNKSLRGLRSDLRRSQIGGLLIAAAILGMAARGFHWI